MCDVIRNLFSLAILSILTSIPSCIPIGPPSGTYKIDTFEFVLSNPPQNVGEAIPNIWIDTNLQLSSLYGGTMTSSLPCSVKIDYTDNTLALKDAVLTEVKITYDDGGLAPAAKLPIRIAAREYESVNSVAGGRIVKSKSSIISGSIPNAITRAEPLRLQIEGYFTKVDGNKISFSIDQHFNMRKENTVKSAAEVLQDK